MLLLMKVFVKKLDLFLSSLFIQSNLQKCMVWPKKLEKANKNGTRLV
jgi:hypothetical protein